MELTETTEEVLLGADSERIESLDVLLDRCLAALTSHLWQACWWPDSLASWTIGDYRFSIVEFEPTPGVPLYIQLWSEPEEPVLMEVASGNRNPRALKFVWRNQRKALDARGFTVGGCTADFQKELSVSSPDEAEVAAREMLTIFFEVFGYRGEQRLTMKLHAASRSEQKPVHVSLSPEDFTKIARQAGFRASLVVAESSAPVVTLTRGPFKSVVIFGSPIPRHNLFGAVLLRAPVREASSLLFPTPADADEPLARFVVDDEGRVTAETSLRFDGGVTTEWIAKSLERWRRAVRKYQRLMKNSTKESIRRVGPDKRRMSVH